MPRSAWYTLGFAAAICLVCSILVTSAAVSLEEKQEVNKLLDKQKNVLIAAGLADSEETISAEEIHERFEAFEPVVVDLVEQEEDPAADFATIDQQKMSKDPDTSFEAPKNPAQIPRVSNKAVIYKLKNEDGGLKLLVLPVEGKGLWSTMYGFVAVSPDISTIEGLTFYQHGETPGLGGEVDNPRWKNLWPGRKIFDDAGDVAITVIKGSAGPPEENPYEVDGLSGATITSRGVTYLLQFWLGDNGFGPYLEQYRSGQTDDARNVADFLDPARTSSNPDHGRRSA
ncbi:MAG: Na(+)-translocating NADH-quinone reductase subunit C [Acidobacteriota bacterium]|nr:Na(+)-translocating NADH-quinone reductase subunit C [Acidobacteriota bacterium]